VFDSTIRFPTVWDLYAGFGGFSTIFNDEMAYNPQFEAIGNAFVQHYYSQFDSGEPTQRGTRLHELYDAQNSYLTFEGNQLTGKAAIVEKYNQLPFKHLQRAITKVDCQPLADGSVLISAFGQLKTDDDPVQSFFHAFILKSAGANYFISNEIFRLVLHNM